VPLCCWLTNGKRCNPANSGVLVPAKCGVLDSAKCGVSKAAKCGVRDGPLWALEALSVGIVGVAFGVGMALRP